MYKALVVVAGAFAFAACGGGEKKSDAPPADAGTTPAVAPPADSAGGTATAAAAAPITGTTHTVNMIGDEKGYRFEPAEITIKAGDGISFVNVKGGPHNVAFDAAAVGAAKDALMANMTEQSAELSGKMLVTDGEKYTMSFGGVAAGTYEAICTPHAAMNMKMKITVQ
jgi:plastocyanin